MPNPEAFSYYDRTSRADAPAWENRVAVKSLQAYFAYNVIPDAALVAPTPLLIVHGTTDLFLWPEFALQAYESANGDKELGLGRDAQPHRDVRPGAVRGRGHRPDPRVVGSRRQPAASVRDRPEARRRPD